MFFLTRYVQNDNVIFDFQRSQLFLSLWGRIAPVDDISSTVPHVRLAVFKRRETFFGKLVGRFHAQDCEDNFTVTLWEFDSLCGIQTPRALSFFVSKNPIFFERLGFLKAGQTIVSLFTIVCRY